MYIYIYNTNRPPSLGHALSWAYISGRGGTYNNNDNKNDNNMRARTNTMMVLNAALSLFLVLVSLSWSLLDIYNWLSGPWADLDKRHPETTPRQPQKTPTWVRGIPAFPMHPSKCFFCLVFGCSLPPRKPQNSVPGPRDEPKGIPKPIKKNSPGTMEFRDINAHRADGPRKTKFIYFYFSDRLFFTQNSLCKEMSVTSSKKGLFLSKIAAQA